MDTNGNLLLFNMEQEITTQNTKDVGYCVCVSGHVQHIYLSVHRGFAVTLKIKL